MVQPVLDAPNPVEPYAKGTWGPQAAMEMLPGEQDWIPCNEDVP